MIHTPRRRRAIHVADVAATWLTRLLGLAGSGALGAVSLSRFLSPSWDDMWRVAACAVFCVSLCCMVAWFERVAEHTPLPARPRLWGWFLAVLVAIAVVAVWLGGFRAGLVLLSWRDKF